MENLESKTTEQLHSAFNATKIISYALIGVLSLLLAVTLYGLLTKEDNSFYIALMVVPLSCSAILPLQFSSMKKIKKEIISREAAEP